MEKWETAARALVSDKKFQVTLLFDVILFCVYVLCLVLLPDGAMAGARIGIAYIWVTSNLLVSTCQVSLPAREGSRTKEIDEID